jgi:hypothetical protein
VLNNTHNYKDATLNVMTAKELTAAEAIRYKKGGALQKQDMGKTAMDGDTIDYNTEDVNGQGKRGSEYVQVGSVISANMDIISK